MLGVSFTGRCLLVGTYSLVGQWLDITSDCMIGPEIRLVMTMLQHASLADLRGVKLPLSAVRTEQSSGMCGISVCSGNMLLQTQTQRSA